MQIKEALIGIVTRNDKENFVKAHSAAFQMIRENLARVVTCQITYRILVVNDGQPYPSSVYDKCEVIQHPDVKFNGACYNQILRHAVANGIEHIFIQWDNVVPKQTSVYDRYIETALATGLPLLAFGQSSVQGADKQMHPNTRAKINYTPNVGIALNLDTTSAFTYLNRSVIDKVGYFDERYKGVLDLADYFYRSMEAGYTPPWSWFPDILYGDEYLELLPSNDKQPLLRSRILHAAALFQHKYSLLPDKIPSLSLDSVKAQLKLIKEKELVKP